MSPYSSWPVCGDMSKKKDTKVVEPDVVVAKEFKITLKCCLIIGILASGVSITYNETLNWHASAVGRLLMAQILPYWNWEKLYNARCLIEKEPKLKVKKSTFVEPLECTICEDFTELVRLRNTTFSNLRDQYLVRGLPVIVEGSHSGWTSAEARNFPQKLLETDAFMNSDPCNLRTNLALKKWAHLPTLLHNIQEAKGFLHFRSCEFKAVKSTRRMHEKPYFYESHLEPPNIVWMLMSNNFSARKEIKLNVIDLVMVKQMAGKMRFVLEGKEECKESCGSHIADLRGGEVLVFWSEIWSLSYKPIVGNFSVTIITETYWKNS